MHFGIIAAGEGSRLTAEGVATPKPLVNLGGEPMIGRLVNIFVAAGADSVNVVVNSGMKEVISYLEMLGETLGVPLRLKACVTPSSMHTFFELMTLMPDAGRFVATTVDTVFRREDFIQYVDAFSKEPEDVAGLFGVTDFIEDEKPLYVETGSDMTIEGFHDCATHDIKYISAGVYGLDGRALHVLKVELSRGVTRMRNFQRALIREGLRIKAWPMGKVVDVDHPQDIERAENFLKGFA